MEQQQSVNELNNLLRSWDEESTNVGYNPIPTLTRLCEIFELESKNYIKKDPDPFDDRHPSRIDPTCALGQMYKILFRKDELMTTLVTDYLKDGQLQRRTKDCLDLNVAASRLVINLIPGLETTVVFESPSNESLVPRLFKWAENSPEPLQTYATGLLAAAMEINDIAANFKDDNKRLVPMILDRIHLYYAQLCNENKPIIPSTEPSSSLNNPNDCSKNDSIPISPDNSRPQHISKFAQLVLSNKLNDQNLTREERRKLLTNVIIEDHKACNGEVQYCVDLTGDDEPIDSAASAASAACDDSNSSCMIIESKSNWVQVYPVTLTTKLVYCFKYLIPTGEYQEFLTHAYEKNSLRLVMKIISASEKLNGYLTFEALKYLSALLCHKKFATEFIASQGLQKLLLIPKPSIASTGVSICFYYLSYCEEAMERICLLPEHVLVDLVKYALWMLECSHDSSRCHATMFFSYSFHFRVIQEIFDNHDGLRKLVNVISTLPLLSSEDPTYNVISEDAECSARQIIRHVCAGLKHYFEAHLHIKAQQIRRAKMRDSGLLMTSSMVQNFYTVPGYKSTKKSQAEVHEEIELLLNAVSMKSHWTPVDQLIKLGGLNLLLQIINLAHEWNFSGRCEMIKNALEVLNICAVLPKVQLALCEPTINIQGNNPSDSSILEDDPQAENDNVGLNIIIKAAEGELLDAEIQKAALSVIITCVCAPIHREGGSIAYYSAHGSAKKRMHKTNDDGVIEKIWDCIRNNNGIMVLLTLMTLKTPITDVDAIRGLASRALAGLARSESVRQIISKLPLFNSGQLQNLVKNPVLQEKRQEHVTFQKYALELMELVTGKAKHNGAEIEASLANINRANIVAQTKINFNEQHLLLLIHQHLIAKGYTGAADKLVQEANLNITEKKSVPFTYVAHCRNRSIGGGISPASTRYTIQNQKSEIASSSNGVLNAGFNMRGVNSSSPIRLNVNKRTETRPKPELEPETESPMSKLVHKKIDQDIPLSSDNNSNSTVSLESIITEYLTNQHASCKHPMVTCPPFNLFVPHKCPDPKPRSAMCTNFAMRFSKNIHSRKLDQRLIHSRFCPTLMFRMDNDDEAYFTCSEFLNQNRIAIGTDGGEIKVFNLFTSQEELTFSAHDAYVSHIECSNDERLMVSSASWRGSLSSLWSINNDTINLRFSLDLEEYCTFSKYDQSKLLGTKNETATIYDIETSRKLLELVPRHSNRYNRNRAVFDATNELVLSDGVLWDATSDYFKHRSVGYAYISVITHSV
ncbi:protein mahjong isoform X4 [Sipha flava]|uniref:Protein mahjong isoform X4 n=1 Tax=Sipha flava TaxID=143950 RepID=A0A8B8GBM0_9HEMI|nr:protein mahjong isoform X4 [Sipha flava]